MSYHQGASLPLDRLRLRPDEDDCFESRLRLRVEPFLLFRFFEEREEEPCEPELRSDSRSPGLSTFKLKRSALLSKVCFRARSLFTSTEYRALQEENAALGHQRRDMRMAG